MNTKYILVILFCISTLSCKKFVEVDAPSTSLVTTSIFNNKATAIAAQIAIYAQMQNYPIFFDYCTALTADELTSSLTSQSIHNLYTNSLSATSDEVIGGVVNFWMQGYNYVYQENAIIENVSQSSNIETKYKNFIIGEAKFIRAYWYFNLVNMYGDVPLVLTTDYKINSVAKRNPQSEVYEQIVSDLLSAKNLLGSNFLDATDDAVTVDRVRPTTWAASALLARVYLYMDKYDLAEKEADTVINNSGMFSLEMDLNAVFKKNSNEAIWQIQPPSSNKYASEGFYFVLTTIPGPEVNGSSTLSSQLLNAFEPNDKRKLSWVGRFNDGNNNYYFPYKYKDGSTYTGDIEEYSMVLRLAEQYLIRAEARAMQQNFSGAISDVNTIRSRAGLEPLPSGLNQEQIIAAISKERQVELFTEGDRWYNLKRTNTIDEVMGGTNGACALKGGEWQSFKQLFPIPNSELIADGNLVQNSGY